MSVRDILVVLEQNARATPEEIAEMTGIPLDEVRETIAQAERDRAIVKYKTLINWERVGEEEVMACIVTADGRDIDNAALLDYCVERMPRFAVPRYVEAMAELAKTATGKIQKAAPRTTTRIPAWCGPAMRRPAPATASSWSPAIFRYRAIST